MTWCKLRFDSLAFWFNSPSWPSGALTNLVFVITVFWEA